MIRVTNARPRRAALLSLRGRSRWAIRRGTREVRASPSNPPRKPRRRLASLRQKEKAAQWAALSFVLAERGGFEPPIGLTLYTLSRRATSTAHPPLLVYFFAFTKPHIIARIPDGTTTIAAALHTLFSSLLLDKRFGLPRQAMWQPGRAEHEMQYPPATRSHRLR